MSRGQDEQAIAVAAMFQAATLVNQIATKGMISQSSFETSINSLFELNPASTEDVYGGSQFLAQNLALGLKTMGDVIDKRRDKDSNIITNYVLAMIMLQQKLSKDEAMLTAVGQRIEQLKDKAEKYFSDHEREQSLTHLTHSNIVAGLDGIYQDTISTFTFRIKVQGDPRHLQNNENAAKVRALLLAGIRSAMLWRQVGGRRWHLLLFKARLKQSITKIQQHN